MCTRINCEFNLFEVRVRRVVLSLWESRRDSKKNALECEWCEKKAVDSRLLVKRYWWLSTYWVSVQFPELKREIVLLLLCEIWFVRKYVKAVLKCLLAWIKWIIANSTGTIVDKLRILNLYMYIYVLKHETISINVSYKDCLFSQKMWKCAAALLYETIL